MVYGMVWYGVVWYGMVWYGTMVWYGMVWYGIVWYGMVWYGMVWYGMVWYGMVWCCLVSSLSTTKRENNMSIIMHIQLGFTTCFTMWHIEAIKHEKIMIMIIIIIVVVIMNSSSSVIIVLSLIHYIKICPNQYEQRQKGPCLRVVSVIKRRG